MYFCHYALLPVYLLLVNITFLAILNYFQQKMLLVSQTYKQSNYNNVLSFWRNW